MRGPCKDCGKDSGEFGFQPNRTFLCPACKIKRLGHEPRVLTVEESRARFLDQLMSMLYYWEKESRVPDLHGKMEGFAHSMLVMLDGGSGDLPGFIVAPHGYEGDAEFHKSIGEDWWPYVPKNLEDKIKNDIAGGLHDEWAKVCKKWADNKVVQKFEKANDLKNKVLVYHVKDVRAPGGRSLSSEIAAGMVAINFPENHQLVAEIEVHSEGTRGLDEAYKLTQHIDRSWTENAFVKPKEGRHRSTHIGDVLVIRDLPYVCEPMGWRMFMSADQKVS